MYGNGPTALVDIRTILGLMTTIVDESCFGKQGEDFKRSSLDNLKKSDNSEVKTRRHLR